jgi:hypothetical protein
VLDIVERGSKVLGSSATVLGNRESSRQRSKVVDIKCGQ